jgi:hypothetical protein
MKRDDRVHTVHAGHGDAWWNVVRGRWFKRLAKQMWRARRVRTISYTGGIYDPAGGRRPAGRGRSH